MDDEDFDLCSSWYMSHDEEMAKKKLEVQRRHTSVVAPKPARISMDIDPDELIDGVLCDEWELLLPSSKIQNLSNFIEFFKDFEDLDEKEDAIGTSLELTVNTWMDKLVSEEEKQELLGLAAAALSLWPGHSLSSVHAMSRTGRNLYQLRTCSSLA